MPFIKLDEVKFKKVAKKLKKINFFFGKLLYLLNGCMRKGLNTPYGETMKKLLITLLALSMIGVVSCAKTQKNSTSNTGAAVSKTQERKAPDFNLKLTDKGNGRKVSLKDYKGKTLLLHFWATWCPPCRAELPGMQALFEKLESQGDSKKLEFLGVCVSDTEAARSAFMKENGYTFTGALDQSGIVAASYGVQGIPTTVLIGPEGTILKMNVGMMSEEKLAQFVEGYVE